GEHPVVAEPAADLDGDLAAVDVGDLVDGLPVGDRVVDVPPHQFALGLLFLVDLLEALPVALDAGEGAVGAVAVVDAAGLVARERVDAGGERAALGVVGGGLDGVEDVSAGVRLSFAAVLRGQLGEADAAVVEGGLRDDGGGDVGRERPGCVDLDLDAGLAHVAS